MESLRRSQCRGLTLAYFGGYSWGFKCSKSNSEEQCLSMLVVHGIPTANEYASFTNGARIPLTLGGSHHQLSILDLQYLLGNDGPLDKYWPCRLPG
jgi:hypothetical protein